LDEPVRQWLRIWAPAPLVGLAGSIFHFWGPVPVSVWTNIHKHVANSDVKHEIAISFNPNLNESLLKGHIFF